MEKYNLLTLMLLYLLLMVVLVRLMKQEKIKVINTIFYRLLYYTFIYNYKNIAPDRDILRT